MQQLRFGRATTSWEENVTTEYKNSEFCRLKMDAERANARIDGIRTGLTPISFTMFSRKQGENSVNI